MSTVGIVTASELAGLCVEDAAIVADLKAGSEEAYARLIAQYNRAIYGLVYRILSDPTDVLDTTQEVFLKVFRGMPKFSGKSSLKTWIYRIAIHEASNRRRWFMRHKVRELSIEPNDREVYGTNLLDRLADASESPFDRVARMQEQLCLEEALLKLHVHYRTTVVLRDIEGLSYEEIADVTETSLGTVKSRLVRGREALRKHLERHRPRFGTDTEKAGGHGGAVKPSAEAKNGHPRSAQASGVPAQMIGL